MKTHSIKQNMFMNSILTVSNFVFPLVIYAYVARVLLAEGTGQIAFVQAIIAYFAYIAALGIPSYALRECAKCRDDRDKFSKLVHEMLIINLLSMALACLTLFISVVCISKLRAYSTLFAVMSWSMVLQSIGMEWLYQSLEKYTYITIRSIVFKVISIVLIFLLVKTPQDLVLYGALTVFASGASNIFNFIHARKYIYFKRYPHYDLAKHFKPILIFFVASLVISIYGHFDVVMLGFLKGNTEVGLYNAASKFKLAALSVSTALTTVLVPRMSLYAGTGAQDKFIELLCKSFRVTCVLMLPVCIFTMLNVRDLILFLCGPDYVGATSAAIVLMFCVLALSMTNLIGNQMMIPLGKEKEFSQTVFIGMWINLGLNFALIPFYGIVGAAIATCITETFNACWMAKSCPQEVAAVFHGVSLKPYVFALGGSVVCSLLLKHIAGEFPLVVRLIVQSAFFFACYYLYLLAKREPLVLQILEIFKQKMRSMCLMCK